MSSFGVELLFGAVIHFAGYHCGLRVVLQSQEKYYNIAEVRVRYIVKEILTRSPLLEKGKCRTFIHLDHKQCPWSAEAAASLAQPLVVCRGTRTELPVNVWIPSFVPSSTGNVSALSSGFAKHSDVLFIDHAIIVTVIGSDGQCQSVSRRLAVVGRLPNPRTLTLPLKDNQIKRDFLNGLVNVEVAVDKFVHSSTEPVFVCLSVRNESAKTISKIRCAFEKQIFEIGSSEPLFEKRLKHTVQSFKSADFSIVPNSCRTITFPVVPWIGMETILGKLAIVCWVLRITLVVRCGSDLKIRVPLLFSADQQRPQFDGKSEE
eukprot:ANDGO_02702.mRNA.1 hypothetical protein